jgi:hypothetical protein
MKKLLISIITITVLASSLLYLQSCDIKNPTENVKLLINTDAPPTAISVNIFDGNTNTLITGLRTIRLDIEGPDKNKITDMGKNPKTSFLSGDGFISFGVIDGAVYPLNITVIAKTDGYLTTSIPLKINSSGGSFDIYLVKKTSPPQGVVVNTSTIANAVNGVVQTEGSISTSISNGAGGVSKIRLPAGTIITDNLGEPLNGILTCELAYFDPTKASSRRCFPGGFTVNSGGSSYIMYTAGFSSLVITETGSGKVAKNFSGPLPEVTIEIPTGTNNYQFSRPIQTGDLIPILSYDPGTGAWKDENAAGGTVITGANSNFAIKFNINHLTYYNLDFKGPTCPTDINVHFPSLCGENGQPLRVEIYSVTPNGEENLIQTVNQPANDPLMRLNSAPTVFRLKVYNLSGELVYDQVITGCPIDVFVTFSGSSVSHAVSGILTAVCSDQEMEFNPTIPIYFRKTGTERFYYFGYMVNGYISTSCLPYGNYDFVSYYETYALYNNNVGIFSDHINVTYTIPDCTP